MLGGGLVPGSVVLIGGHPGAGKSTLLLQCTGNLSKEYDCLYVTGEESLQQVAMRAARLGLPEVPLKLLSDTDLDTIIAHTKKVKPQILVIDSIQVMALSEVTSAAGSVTQVRECAAFLTRFAKETQTVVLLVGHVNKEGNIAGPKVLEHMIDCSLLLEGDGDARYRTLRSHKNRFGSVNELGIFVMLQQGLREVKNPSAIFLSRPEQIAAGTLVTAIWEGTRPLLLEIQALVDESVFGQPRRLAVGIEQNRLAMLLAILHKHGELAIGDQDVYINLVGGIKSNETSMDLAVLLAVASSFSGKALPEDMIVFGEIGLTGEIRPVANGQQRIFEAVKHGFKRAIIPFGNLPKNPIKGTQIHGVARLSEALELI